MDHLAQKMDITCPEKWYEVNRNRVVLNGGRGIIAHHGSLPAALKFSYPEYPWILGRFSISPKGTWETGGNIRDFLDYCSERLGVDCLDDWYGVSRERIDELGGRMLMNLHGGLEGALRYAYPEHSWVSGRFSYAQRNSWSNPASVREFFEFLKEKFEITREEEWYRISVEQVIHLGGGGVYMKFGTLGKALKFAYPEKKWKMEMFASRDKRTQQR